MEIRSNQRVGFWCKGLATTATDISDRRSLRLNRKRAFFHSGLASTLLSA